MSPANWVDDDLNFAVTHPSNSMWGMASRSMCRSPCYERIAQVWKFERFSFEKKNFEKNETKNEGIIMTAKSVATIRKWRSRIYGFERFIQCIARAPSSYGFTFPLQRKSERRISRFWKWTEINNATILTLQQSVREWERWLNVYDFVSLRRPLQINTIQQQQ